MTTIAITGAAGFIGTHVSEMLLSRGDTVVGLDNFNDFYDPAIKRANAKHLQRWEGFRLVEGDIQSPESLDAVLGSGDVDAIIHLAARAGVRPSVEDPSLYADVNVRGTIQVLEAAVRYGIERFVFASSSSVYGANTKTPFHEEDPVELPESPYAATKRAGELLCRTYHHLYATTGPLQSLAVLRFFTVYGPGQRPEMAISKFTKRMIQGQTIPMFGDGSSLRDYTYVDDIVAGVVAALDRSQGYRIFNLGGGQPVRLDAMIAAVAKAVGVEPVIEELPMQPGDVQVTVSDCSRAREELGYLPQTSLNDGISEYVKWHMMNRHDSDR
ncbi:MAG: epimerase [Myxococcales bacterium]|nr:epimerase [Myxococcales bacterium]